MESNQPDYLLIYKDILHKNFPEKMELCRTFLEKKELSVLDVVALNDAIFGKKNKSSAEENQKFRSYKEIDILKILDYQKKNRLNNTQVANHFKLSRNTISRWKKLFL